MAERKKVLIAEDEPDIRGLILFSLEYAGYEVIEALNGEEAIRLAEEHQPDLVLLDVRMPRMNGYEACALLRAREATQDIPVAFLSARGQEAEIMHGLDVGAEEYILKPFAPDDLIVRVSGILERSARE